MAVNPCVHVCGGLQGIMLMYVYKGCQECYPTVDATSLYLLTPDSNHLGSTAETSSLPINTYCKQIWSRMPLLRLRFLITA